MLREVIVKIGLERIDIQKEVTVEALLDNSIMRLVMSSKFVRKQGFKLKKIEKLIYVINVNKTFNKKGSIENTVKVNIYYQEHTKRTEINMIEGQKQNMILGMLQLAHHNPKIDWRTGEVKMMRYPEECKKQQRPKQGKLEWQKQKEEEKRKKLERREKKKKKGKPKKEYRVAKSETKSRKLIPEKFHK